MARALFGSRWRDWEPGQSAAWRMLPRPLLFAWRDSWWPSLLWPYSPWPPYYTQYFPDPYYGPYYPYTRPRTAVFDILTLGLREGRILPGARVEGFLYLQQATQKGNFLTLSWTPAAANGQPLTTLSSQFHIVR